MNQKEEFMRQLQQENEILVKKNKELMEKLFIQLSTETPSFLQKAKLDKGRSIIDINGIINKNREDTGWKQRHKLQQLKKVLEKETETWRKLVSLVKTEKNKLNRQKTQWRCPAKIKLDCVLGTIYAYSI